MRKDFFRVGTVILALALILIITLAVLGGRAKRKE